MHTALAESVSPGFKQPSVDAQVVFRQILDAMSNPGRIVALPTSIEPIPDGLDPATAAVCLTLLDGDTPIWTDLPPSSPSLSWLQFHCGCPFTDDPGRASFGLATNARELPGLDAFSPGTDETPETAASLIVQVDDLESSGDFILSGPGIPDRRALKIAGPPAKFWDQRQRVCTGFPLGLDLIFIRGAQLAALPRTTHVNG